MKLNLGCGLKPKQGFVNVDMMPNKADIVHNLDKFPWPFDDESADLIVAEDVFEHVENPIGFMTETHRILQHDASLMMRTPHYRSEFAYTDPTHRRLPTEFTWDYWVPGTALFAQNPIYGGVKFRKVEIQLRDGHLFVHLKKR